ncbi:hypothetical protein [Streptomyces achromogenes]|uniref:hypothetical protein n=1 Tax=Streptomyces achromogenes TaxID=67255 RepID=UPI00371D7880
MLRPRHQPRHLGRRGHLHYRPFGGKAIPFEELNGYLCKSGVRYVNAFGIGQKLPAGSSCTYYLDCPGPPVLPSIRNDIVNWAGELNLVKGALLPNHHEPASSADIAGWAPMVREFADLLDAFPTRAIPGTDFVASSDKSYAVYKEELEVTSRINKALGDRAFRGIALGENYFRLLGLNATAPRICEQK